MFTTMDPSQKTVHEAETHWLSGKEKVLCAAVSNEGHIVTMLWDMKGPITCDFLGKGATVNVT